MDNLLIYDDFCNAQDLKWLITVITRRFLLHYGHISYRLYVCAEFSPLLKWEQINRLSISLSAQISKVIVIVNGTIITTFLSIYLSILSRLLPMSHAGQSIRMACSSNSSSFNDEHHNCPFWCASKAFLFSFLLLSILYNIVNWPQGMWLVPRVSTADKKSLSYSTVHCPVSNDLSLFTTKRALGPEM